MQFDSTALEGSISDVKVTTLELKAELGKSNQKLLALTQRMETLERRPQRTLTRNQSMAPAHMTPSASMARAPSTAHSPAMGSSSSMMSSSSNAAGLLAAATAEASTTAAEADAAVAPSQGEANVSLASSGGPGPSVNFAADTVSVRSSPTSTPVADGASTSGMLPPCLCIFARYLLVDMLCACILSPDFLLKHAPLGSWKCCFFLCLHSTGYSRSDVGCFASDTMHDVDAGDPKSCC